MPPEPARAEEEASKPEARNSLCWSERIVGVKRKREEEKRIQKLETLEMS